MIHTKEETYTIYNQSCLDLMDSLEENSIDCIVTDPPYEIGFMGKKWDNTGIAFNIDTWKKALRVLKPGGYLLAFNHSRTFHRMMVAIEDAGFELRDTIMYLYGSGFPKSHNLGKSIDKKLGNKREKIGETKHTFNQKNNSMTSSKNGQGGTRRGLLKEENFIITKGNSKLEGWGSALKPAFEPIVMARKPFKGSLTDNVLKHGVGGINIDECRIPTNGEKLDVGGRGNHTRGDGYGFEAMGDYQIPEGQGRFPANVITDGSEEACSGFPNTKSQPNNGGGSFNSNTGDWGFTKERMSSDYNDEGSASRYFYTAKASVKDRDEGLSEFETFDLKDNISSNDISEIKRLLNL